MSAGFEPQTKMSSGLEPWNPLFVTEGICRCCERTSFVCRRCERTKFVWHNGLLFSFKGRASEELKGTCHNDVIITVLQGVITRSSVCWLVPLFVGFMVPDNMCSKTTSDVQLMFFFCSEVSKLFGAQGSPSSGSLLNL